MQLSLGAEIKLTFIISIYGSDRRNSLLKENDDVSITLCNLWWSSLIDKTFALILSRNVMGNLSASPEQLKIDVFLIA